MIAYRRLRFCVGTENFSPARSCLVNLFQRLHVNTSEELHDNKLPEKPKKPMNAYLRFRNSVADEYKQKNPEVPFKHVQKLIATAWSTLDADKKNEFVKQFNDETELYKKKLEEYKDLVSKSEDSTDPDIVKLKSELLQKPKRSPNAFLLYKSSRRAEADSQNISFKEWNKQVSADWHTLPLKEKSVFTDMAAKMAEDYKSEKSAWEQKMLDEGHNDVLSVVRKTKGSSAHNVTLQAGQKTKTESLENTELLTRPKYEEQTIEEQLNVIEQSMTKSSLVVKEVHPSCQPISHIITSENISEPLANPEPNTPLTTDAIHIEEIKKPTISHISTSDNISDSLPKSDLDVPSNINTIDTREIQTQSFDVTNKSNTENLRPLDIKAESSKTNQHKKMHYFDNIQGISNIKSEYVFGVTCSLISLSLYLWYLSYV